MIESICRSILYFLLHAINNEIILALLFPWHRWFCLFLCRQHFARIRYVQIYTDQTVFGMYMSLSMWLCYSNSCSLYQSGTSYIFCCVLCFEASWRQNRSCFIKIPVRKFTIGCVRMEYTRKARCGSAS